MSTGQSVVPTPDTTRLTSGLIAAAVAVGGWLLATATNTGRSALIAGLAGGLLGLAVLIRDTGTPVGTVIATLFLPVSSLIGVVAIGLSVRDLVPLVIEGESVIRPLIGQFGVTIAIGIAAFGVIATLDTGVGNGAVATLWGTAVLALLGMSVPLGGLLIVQFDALTTVPTSGVNTAIISSVIYQPAEPLIVILSFWFLMCVQAGILKLLVGAAPVIELTPQTKEATVTDVLSQTHSVLNLLFALSLSLMGLALMIRLSSTNLTGLFDRYPLTYTVFRAPGFRRGLVAGIGLATFLTLLLTGLQLVTGRVTNTIGRLVPSILAGGSSAALAVVASPVIPRLLARVPDTTLPINEVATALTPPGVILAALTTAVALLTGVLTVIVTAGGLQYIPQRTAGSALASGGLGFGAIAAGIGGSQTVVVFAAVGVSIFVWNLGERSVTTRAELGAFPSVQLEAIHLLSALGLAMVGVSLAWVLYTNVLGQLVVSGGTLIGVLASAVGVLILVVTLRG